VAQQNQWIKHSYSQGQCKGCQQLDGHAKKLGWVGKIKQIGLQEKAKYNDIFC